MKKFLACITALLVLLVSITPIHAQESTMFSLDKIDEFTNEAISKGTFPGATVLIKKGDRVLFHKSFGSRMVSDMGVPVNNPMPMQNSTLYDLASVTKVMATTQGIMVLYDQGLIDLDAPVSTYLKDFGQNGKEEVTVRQLLTHTSGLTPWKPTFLYGNTRAQELEYINKLPLEVAPGTRYAYSDFSFMTLAFIIEAVTNTPVEDYLHNSVYAPLGMDRTTYLPKQNGFSVDEIAATSWGNPYEKRMVDEVNYPGFGYDCTDDKAAFDAFTGWREYTLIGEVNDGNAGMANGGVAGHAGLFSNAEDLSKLGSAMLNNGIAENGYQLYSKETIEEFTKPQAFGRGLGFQVNGAAENSGYVGKYATDSVFGHAGFTGTHVTFDSNYDLQVIILTNKMNNGTNSNGSYASPYAYARQVTNYVYESINKDIENANTDSLAALILSVDDLKEEDYTSESWKNLVEAIDQASLILNNKTAMSYDIDNANNLVKSAIDSLVKKDSNATLNFDELTQVLAKAKEVDGSKYTPESYNSLKNEIEKADVILANQTAVDLTQQSIDKQVVLLNDALSNLKELATVVDSKETPNTGVSSAYPISLLALSGIAIYFTLKKKHA